MGPQTEADPLLRRTSESFSEPGVERDQTNKVSTEEVVNAAANSPSLLYLVVILWLMSVNMVNPIAAFYPNFGGFIPYESWRCANTSQACFNRTKLYYNTGWKPVRDKAINLEYRCTMILKGLDNSPTIQIIMDSRIVGEISVDIGGQEQQVNVVSFTNCKNSESRCEKKFPVQFETTPRTMECRIVFAGSSWAIQNTSLSCNSKSYYLLDDQGILPVIDQMEQIKVVGIESFDLNCPDSNQYTKDTLCGAGKFRKQGSLRVDKDFQWVTRGRTSFSVDWNLQCEREYQQKLFGSVFFCGGLLGSFIGGLLFDLIGRKNGLLIGSLVSLVSTFLVATCSSMVPLFACRFFQGFGAYMSATGGSILSLEYVPLRYRAVASGVLQMLWAVGYLLSVLTAFYITDWHWLAVSCGFFYVWAAIPVVIIPESPRFLLVNKDDEDRAKSSLRWLISLNKSEFDLDKVTLEDKVEDETDKKTFMEAVKELWIYKALLSQIFTQMWLWFVSGFLYFGFSYSWSSFGNNIYESYLFAAVGECVAYTISTFAVQYWGRRPSLITSYCTAGVCFLVALLPYNIASGFKVEQLSCLLGSMFVSATYAIIYLYTIELSPTSHRGTILGSCNFVSRIGSLLGPEASLLLSWNKTVTLIIFAVLALTAGLATLMLPNTKGIATPNTAREVQARRDNAQLQRTK